jgi:alkaline phosphatase
MAKLSFFVFLCCFLAINSHPQDLASPQVAKCVKGCDTHSERQPIDLSQKTSNFPPKKVMKSFQFPPPEIEKDPDYWNNKAKAKLRQQLSKSKLNENAAKNVIFFLGDGMGLSTLMATRVFKGDEAEELSFEKFPFVGLAKTYCTNTQVSDSACTATSYMSGIKANYGTIGLTAAVLQGDCLGQNNTLFHVDSIIKLAQDRGLRTGIVTNTQLTDASPAGAYAHIANRNWESNARVESDGENSEICPDIAYQMVHGAVGKRLNVIMGGGRREFITKSDVDIDGNVGLRTDCNLLEQWKKIHQKMKHNYAYIETKDQLLSVDNSVERLLAIFHSTDLPYRLDGGAISVPSLSEMVSKALDILKADNDKGFFLFVEGGKIDHAHHYGLAKKALSETLELEEAVTLARARMKEEDTLVVVTSDHSHAMTVSGYAVSSLAVDFNELFLMRNV